MAIKVKIALHLQAPATATEIAAELRAQADLLEGKNMSAKAAPKAAKKKADEEEDESEDADESEEEDESDDSDESEDDDASDDEEDDEEAANPAGKKKCLAALQAYAKEHDKKAAIKTMKKATGFDSVHEVKPSQYPALLKALKV